MLINQVVIILDDEVGTGHALAERFLLEESKVILCTSEITVALTRWQDEVVNGKLIIIDLMSFRTTEDFQTLFTNIIKTFKRIDGIIQCHYLSDELIDFKHISVENHKIITLATQFLERTKGSSLLLVQTVNNSSNVITTNERIKKLTKQVISEADQLIRSGIRHNLLINENYKLTGSTFGFTNTAIFLTSDLSTNVYGQTFVVREQVNHSEFLPEKNFSYK